MKRRLIFIGLSIIVVGVMSIKNIVAGERSFKSITPDQAVQMMKEQNITVLDVRTKDEFVGELGHLKGAILIPVQSLAEKLAKLDKQKGKPMLVICRGGVRSMRASKLLSDNGFTPINVLGGMEAMQNVKAAPIVRH